jgi:diacylglycerol kinase (ATP)
MPLNVINFAIIMEPQNRQNKNSLFYQLRTFGYAFHGLKIFFRSEAKARIHLFLAILVTLLGIFLHLGTFEWIAVSIAIGLVFLAEILNTVIEGLVDHISPGKSEMARSAKDLASAAVLIAAFTALAIGLFIFIPKIIYIIRSI